MSIDIAPYAMIHPADTASINPSPAIMFPLTCFALVAAPVLLLLPFAFPPIALLTPVLDDDEAPAALVFERVAEVLGCTVTTVVSASVLASVLEAPVDEAAALLEPLGVDAEAPFPDDEEPADVVLDEDELPPLLPPPVDDPESAVPSPPEIIVPVPHGIFSPVGCVCSGAATYEDIIGRNKRDMPKFGKCQLLLTLSLFFSCSNKDWRSSTDSTASLFRLARSIESCAVLLEIPVRWTYGRSISSS